jgi:hypothetical protein
MRKRPAWRLFDAGTRFAMNAVMRQGHFARRAAAMDTDLEHSVTQAIEDHLALNPQAADSAVGVALWWLSSRGLVVSTADVEPVLAAMVLRRSLRCVRLADGTVLYSKNRAAAH